MSLFPALPAGPSPLQLPPANLEAEQALLGALLRNNKAYDRVSELLRPEHFADEIHARVYEAIRRRVEAGELADAVTLRRDFENSGQLDDAGGPAYLATLLAAMVGIVNAASYARIIHDCWMRRQLIEVCRDGLEMAHGAEEVELDAAAIRDRVDGNLARLAQEGVSGGIVSSDVVARRTMDLMSAAIERGGGLAGVTTGLAGLDRMTGGLRPGQFVVVGARASMGKTSLGGRIAYGAAAAGEPVLFVTIEMTEEQVMARLIAGAEGLRLDSVLLGMGLNPEGERVPLPPKSEEVTRAGERARLISQMPLHWLHHGSPTTAMIRGHARGLQRRHGLKLIVIDYLGLCRPGAPMRDGNRVQEIGLITRELKAMAVDLGLPVLALAQLSRAVENRDDQRPRLSDLRDSGEIEQHADIVALLYRAHYYLARSRPARKPREKTEDFEARIFEWQEQLRKSEGRAEVDIAKQRQGPVGPVRLRFRDDNTWFSDETDHYSAGGD